ncbi:MAG: hypothetical protein BroJett014_27790 [Planctomycetota bacterium]|nr:MAG: hypothetical protein BroJett014_27790 [Planctomycetota bacterium]
MFKLLAAIFRNTVSSKSPSQSKFMKSRGLKPALTTFEQTLLFDAKGVASSDGSSLLHVPYPDDFVPPKALIGKALDVRDAKDMLKLLPKGKLGQQPFDASYNADDEKFTFKAANGQKLEAKAISRIENAPGGKAQWPDWHAKMPKHGEYHEAAVDGKRFKKLVSDAVAQDAALGRKKFGRAYQPKLVLRVSKSDKHPIELHTDQGVQGYCAPITDPVKHGRPQKAKAETVKV